MIDYDKLKEYTPLTLQSLTKMYMYMTSYKGKTMSRISPLTCHATTHRKCRG